MATAVPLLLLVAISLALVLPGWRARAVFDIAARLLWQQRWLVNRVTCFLGMISYSLYLMHPLVIPRLYGAMEFLQGRGLPAGVVFLASLALTLALAVPLAYLTYRLIERPAMLVGKRWLRRGRAPVTAIGGDVAT